MNINLQSMMFLYEELKPMFSFSKDQNIQNIIEFVEKLNLIHNKLKYKFYDNQLIVWNKNTIDVEKIITQFDDYESDDKVTFNDYYKNNKTLNLIASMHGYFTRDYYLSSDFMNALRHSMLQCIQIIDAQSHKIISSEFINPKQIDNLKIYYDLLIININTKMKNTNISIITK